MRLRICIAGGPRTGKTTLATELRLTEMESGRNIHIPIRSTDVLAHLPWSEQSAEAAKWFDDPGPWIIEGCTVSRALRKWREAHPGQLPPCDQVIFLDKPHEPLTKGQMSMTKGIWTVHKTLLSWLSLRPV